MTQMYGALYVLFTFLPMETCLHLRDQTSPAIFEPNYIPRRDTMSGSFGT